MATFRNPHVPRREPEIIPPTRVRGLSDEQLDRLASVLDDIFHIPGTKIRVGLDPIIGLIPGVGDVITGLMSFLIVFAAWQRGLPKVTISRMMINIGIDTLLGCVPIVGDAFDTVWKSNRMNYNLLVRYRGGTRTSSVVRDWLFFVGLVLFAAAMVAAPVLVMIWLVHVIRHH